MFVLEGQRLATEVRGCVGVKDGAARLGGVVTQSDVPPAAQDVALSARTPLCMMRPHTQTHTHINKCRVRERLLFELFKRLWERHQNWSQTVSVCSSPHKENVLDYFNRKYVTSHHCRTL